MQEVAIAMDHATFGANEGLPPVRPATTRQSSVIGCEENHLISFGIVPDMGGIRDFEGPRLATDSRL